MTIDNVTNIIKCLYYRTDKNADNIITLEKLIEELVREGISRGDVIAAFKAADRDSDGNVTREEVEIRAREVSKSQNSASFMNLDGNGLVTDSDKKSYPTQIQAETVMSILSILSGGDGGKMKIANLYDTGAHRATTAYVSIGNNRPPNGRDDYYT